MMAVAEATFIEPFAPNCGIVTMPHDESAISLASPVRPVSSEPIRQIPFSGKLNSLISVPPVSSANTGIS